MTHVRLVGRLVCASAAQAEVVHALLPQHVVNTRDERGCISFEVTATDDPLVWSVAECFVDAEAFRAHQRRVAASAWGAATAGITREYTVTGLDDRPSTLADEAWRAERALLTPAVRRDRAASADLLAPDFTEIGQSGRLWTREAIVEALVGEDDAASAPVISEDTARLLSPDVVQLTYLLSMNGRSSRRSAIWQRHGAGVHCLFHQGTSAPSP